MEEFGNVQMVSLWGFAIAVVFGFVANKTHFCVMGAISDVLHMGSRGRLGAWFTAIGIAIIGTGVLQFTGLVDVSKSRYLTPNFGWLGYLLGGVLFGVGMTLAGGCGQRNLVRLGGGNLKALVVLLVLGITAYMTMRGLLGLVRVNTVDMVSIDLSAHGLSDQGLVTAVQALAGIEDHRWLRAILAALVGLAFLVSALRHAEFRNNFDHLLTGIVLGATVIAAWYVTGHLGNDEFDPVPVEGISFISSTGNAVNYLMTFTGSTINFGIALVFGVIAGSFLYAILSGNFRIETFSNRAEMVSYLVGGALMGFGGILSLGCTIGQGITGMSTLSIGSAIALVSIVFGSALTMKIEYHLLDEKGFVDAVRTGLTEMLLPQLRQAG